jgi:hypothetical protein
VGTLCLILVVSIKTYRLRTSTFVASYLGSQTRDEWIEGSDQRWTSGEKGWTGRRFLYESGRKHMLCSSLSTTRLQRTNAFLSGSRTQVVQCSCNRTDQVAARKATLKITCTVINFLVFVDVQCKMHILKSVQCLCHGFKSCFE